MLELHIINEQPFIKESYLFINNVNLHLRWEVPR